MRRVFEALLLFVVVGLCACAPEGPTAFVTFNLVPSSTCEITPQTTGNKFYPIGRYDVSPGKNAGGAPNCAHPYVVNLLVNSFLRPNGDITLGRAEPDVLQLHSAEVLLTDINHATIKFERVTPPLPNPFMVNTGNSLFPAMGGTPSVGVASVEAIPKAYAAQLDKFVDGQILARIQIFGTTTGDVDVNFKPFVYPIEICDQCLTYCAGQLVKNNITRMDFVKDRCDDNSGSDDRVCIDPDC
jgi:hypothetical protein